MTTSEIKALLESTDPEDRREGAQRIAQSDRSASGLLVRALGDDDWRVRKEAAIIASSVTWREELLASLGAALDDHTNVGLRNAAVEALIAIGPDAVPIAISALSRLDADGRKLAVEVLGGVPDARGIDTLVTALSDVDENVRLAAAEALGSASLAGEDARRVAIQGLTKSLASGETQMKLSALEALARLEAKLAWSDISPLVADSLLRRHALAVAARSAEDEATLALTAAVTDPHLSVAHEALIGIAKRADMQPATIDVMRRGLKDQPGTAARVRKLADQEPDLRGAAAVVLAILGETQDIPRIVEALFDPEMTQRSELALRILSTSAVPMLVDIARGASPAHAAELIALLPVLTQKGSPELLGALRTTIGHSFSEVVTASIKALAALGDATDIVRVVAKVAHEDPRIAASAETATTTLTERFPEEARRALTNIAPGGPLAVAGCLIVRASPKHDTSDLSFLNRALSLAGPRARRAAVEAVAMIGGKAAEETVKLALADEEREVQLAAVRALGKLGLAEPIVLTLRSSQDRELVVAASRALVDADPDQAFAVARELATDDDPALASAAVEAASRLDRARRETVLFLALEHPNVEVVKLAISELGGAIDARSTARLGMCLDHSSWEVRRLSAELLGQAASGAADELLRARLERETDTTVKDAILDALSAAASSHGRGGD